MTRGQQTVLVEARQINNLENTSVHQPNRQEESPSPSDFIPIPMTTSMRNLLINDDALTGSTEVQLNHLTMSSNEPPKSPIAYKSMCPKSPMSPQQVCHQSKSCQRRGRFLVWPAASPSSPGRSSFSTTSTES